MKSHFFILIILCSFLSLSSVNGQQIQTDYLEAISMAKKEQKGIFYLFVNKDDDSESSKSFRKNFLKSDEFKGLSTQFIILEVNCSSSISEQDNAALYCNRLTSVYNPKKLFPSVLATDKTLQVMGDLQSDFSKEEVGRYINFLKTL